MRAPNTVTQRTLSVSLTAKPASGPAPLSTTLTASVSGTATGTINYTFWWDCADPGTIVEAVKATCGDPTNTGFGAKFDAVTNTSQSVTHVYSSAKTFTAKIIAERGTAPPAEMRAPITVTQPTVSVSLTPNPASGPAPLSTTLTASVSGTATGTINYTSWWDCADPGATGDAGTAT